MRIVTLVFGLLMTRMLSGYFSIHDYGTYSQIVLIIGTVSSVTILGMMDGINYFFCKEQNAEKKEKYVSTIFSLQLIASSVAAVVVLAGAVPIAKYFGNNDVKKLIIFAALLPGLQNIMSLLQIMFIAIGKARHIAIRNFLVTIFKLIAILLACYLFDNIVVVLICQVVMEIVQIAYFTILLHSQHCSFSFLRLDKTLLKEILKYCIPMAMFTTIKFLNRDCDKYVVAAFTNTETLAIYANASKQLPFDVIMASFCTVLIPYITRGVSKKEYGQVQGLYKAFLELSYISTTILAIGAICVAPELIEFLYTSKYISGLSIFIVYILIDVFSVFNITLLLSAAGKAKTIMLISLCALTLNLGLNILLYHLMGLIGPAVASLIVTVLQGLFVLLFSAKEIQTSVFKMFNKKFALLFIAELLIMGVATYFARLLLIKVISSGFIVMAICYMLYVLPLLLLNFRKLKENMQTINSCKLDSSATISAI